MLRRCRLEEPGLLDARELEIRELLRPAVRPRRSARADQAELFMSVVPRASSSEAPRPRARDACQRLPRGAREARGAPRGARPGARPAPPVRAGRSVELENPALREVLAALGASYGLVDPHARGGQRSSGPLRMDYEKAIRSVRAAAHELSRFVEEVYDDNSAAGIEEDGDEPARLPPSSSASRVRPTTPRSR